MKTRSELKSDNFFRQIFSMKENFSLAFLRGWGPSLLNKKYSTKTMQVTKRRTESDNCDKK